MGVITEVHGPVVVVECSTLPPIHQALSAANDGETYLFEVHQHLDEQRVRAITLHRSAGLRRGIAGLDRAPAVLVAREGRFLPGRYYWALAALISAISSGRTFSASPTMP